MATLPPSSVKLTGFARIPQVPQARVGLDSPSSIVADIVHLAKLTTYYRYVKLTQQK